MRKIMTALISCWVVLNTWGVSSGVASDENEVKYYTEQSNSWMPDYGAYNNISPTSVTVPEYYEDYKEEYKEYKYLYKYDDFGVKFSDVDFYIELLKKLGFNLKRNGKNGYIYEKNNNMVTIYMSLDNNVTISNGTAMNLPDDAKKKTNSSWETEHMSDSENSYDNNVKVLVNGNQVEFDQPPIIQDGRTLVPMRAIFEAMGCEVDWNGEAQTITVYKTGEAIMSMEIGDNYMWTSFNPLVYLDVPPQIINGRTLVPVRAISESMGAEVNWDGDTRTVSIAYNGTNDSEAENALREYARNNLMTLYNDEDSGYTYDNVKYLFADMSGDGIPELVAAGIYDNITVSYIEIYQYSDINVERIAKGHCQPYHGGGYYPVIIYGNTYLCSYAPSSIHGHSRILMQYNGDKWEDVYNSRVTYDRIKGEINGYIVNNESASEEEYNNFNDLIESGTLKVDDFVDIETL